MAAGAGIPRDTSIKLWPGVSSFVPREELLEDLQAQVVAPCWT